MANVDYKSAWRVRTRTWAVNLLGNCCVDCGVTENLDFDHIDPATKEFEISVGIRDGYGRSRLQIELLKCQLLCPSCHLNKSIEHQDGGRVEHGGGKTGKRNCRCSLCGPKKNEYMRDMRLKLSQVEHGVANAEVAGPNPVSRSGTTLAQ